ncbi:MAG: hypothetical protein N2445_00300, partial [Acidobacteria bacterium]|nr:hypothetical protein [Acidobacteriota bacterium]
MKKAAFLFVIVAFICSGYENSHQQKIANFFGLNTNYEVKTTIISKEDSIPIELANIPKHVAGVAIPERGEIYLFRERTNSYPFGSIEQVYEHELSHIYLFRTIGFRAPRWFDEGVAMKLSGEWGFSDEFYLALSLPKVAFSNFSLSKLEKNFSGYEGASRT